MPNDPIPRMLSILTLGDGDFTFSLDLARHLASSTSTSVNSLTPSIHVTATGIDSLKELTSKYRDAGFVLKSLCSIDEVKVDIVHGVNAVALKRYDSVTAADHVIFNHPHLATEDGMLHARFLSHLFWSVDRLWLDSGGRFHLTLAAGQFERWHCLDAAERQGFELLDRSVFGPPTLGSDIKSYYEFRRHQTGKSFMGRRAKRQSETYTFGRLKDKDRGLHSGPFWFTEPPTRPNFTCPYCKQNFAEDRSVKNHIQSKHPDGHKRKREFTCVDCRDERRVFDTQQALDDHVKAKHVALHTEIAPDWATGAKNGTSEPSPETGGATFGSCDICGVVFATESEANKHESLFLPHSSNVFVDEAANSLRIDDTHSLHCCSYCSKPFRERRAKLQHENHCSKR